MTREDIENNVGYWQEKANLEYIRQRQEHGVNDPYMITEINEAFDAGYDEGYQYALQHPQWIPVEEERPKFDWKDDGTWSSSLPILIYSIHGISIGTFQLDHITGKAYWFFDGSKHEEFMDKWRIVTHWMPLPEEPRKED